ncbi:MAG: NUDIX domain-containing protein [bacterium]|nr:NUDIX domain-containing protein [bacterium]
MQEPAKPGKLYWKFPGGAGEGNETPKQCARREFLEEVGGVEIYENDLVLIKTEQVVDEKRAWRNHTRYFYRVDKDVVNPKARGDEGEIIQIFRPEDAAEMLKRGGDAPRALRDPSWDSRDTRRRCVGRSFVGRSSRRPVHFFFLRAVVLWVKLKSVSLRGISDAIQ